jgi:hypothetical protein
MLEITMTPITTLSYQGRAIRLRGAMLNLHDLWQAAGRPDDRRPADWLLLEETQHTRAAAGPHWSTTEDPLAAAGQAGLCTIDTDGFVATVRGNQAGTWAHWQLALSYAQALSPDFHRWCDTTLRAAIARPEEAGMPAAGHHPLLASFTRLIQQLHRRLDTLERHIADLMFLQLSAQDLLLGKRRHFSERSRTVILRVAAAAPFACQCPCCGTARVLTADGQPVPGAEFDHVYHRGLNRPEHGWLVCGGCHAELTHGGYLARFARLPAFRAFQDAVLAQRRRTHPRFGNPPM